jgi:uncharacterized coiled-coil DUF342 family protein
MPTLEKEVFLEFKERVVEQLDELTTETKAINSKVDKLTDSVSDIKRTMESFAKKDDIKDDIKELEKNLQNYTPKQDFERCREESKANNRLAKTNRMVLLAAIIAAAAALVAAFITILH